VDYIDQVETVKARLADCKTDDERGFTKMLFILDLSYSRAAICRAISEFEKEHKLGEYAWMKGEQNGNS
jgi:hypothetical protein